MTEYKPSRLSSAVYQNGWTQWYYSAVYQNGWTQWHYAYEGDGIPPQGFFGPASAMMRKGDHIAFTSPTHTGALAVAHVSTGVVTAFIGWSVLLI